MRHSLKSAHSSILVPFLVLPENRFAFEALSSIGEGTPRSVYVYGPSGVGKSHLARYAVRSFLSKRPDARVQHLTAGEFAAEFADASSGKTISLFQSATREFDVFVLEDLQVLDGRSQTQFQLLALCNDLAATGCQMIWTSRNSPGEMTGIDKKLLSRFRGGVVAQMRPLELESRIRLLNHFAAFQHLALPADAAEVLAAGMDVSPRELWSFVGRLDTHSRQHRRPVDSDLVRRLLQHEVAPLKPRLDDICRAVARQFGISIHELRSRRQTRGVVLPRQCAMLLARQFSGRSLEQIGHYFGGRDHSTVIHACRRLARLIPHEAELRQNLSQIETALSGN
jgi:chromosomal replication initiator protein